MIFINFYQQYQRQKNKLDWFKDQGWGYKDTEFLVGQDGQVYLTGKRYEFSGEKMPNFRKWAEETVGIRLDQTTPAQKKIETDPPNLNKEFLDSLDKKVDEISTNDQQRILHSHGHTLQDIYALRYSKLEKYVDAVVFITSHEQAEYVVQMANKFNVVLMPFGGGTNVTLALSPLKSETRSIISVDTTRMNRVKWVDKKNMMACVESGILGQDLEKELNRYGCCCGHEPDSVEFSSLGGWISTRASGMKKNKYGNIDDILISVKIVTPTGIYTRCQDIPRMSSGPDINEFILGSEGTLGIITEAVIKIRPIPECVQYDSIIFHDFDLGTEFMHDVALKKVWPASIRLVDNDQFKFGIALKTETKTKMQELADRAKKYFVTDVLKFNPDKMCLATVLYEGSKQEVAQQKAIITQIAKKYRGFSAGPENGRRGYFLTYMIAYLRDYGFNYGFMAESFETSVPWKNVQSLCKNVQKRIIDECKARGVKRDPFVSMRVTQLYDTGAAVYIYFGFLYLGHPNPIHAYHEIEDAAREEIMKNGGCISHHHGVGKLRKRFLNNSVGEMGIKMMKSVKQCVDPNNIFANGNLY